MHGRICRKRADLEDKIVQAYIPYTVSKNMDVIQEKPTLPTMQSKGSLIS